MRFIDLARAAREGRVEGDIQNVPMNSTFNPQSMINYTTQHLTVGTPSRGEWCEKCLLPSRYTVPLIALTETGEHLVIAKVNQCDDCEGDA